MGSDPEDPRPLHCPAEGKQRTKYRGVVLSVTATVKFTKCINDQEVRYCLASFNPTSVSLFVRLSFGGMCDTSFYIVQDYFPASYIYYLNTSRSSPILGIGTGGPDHVP